MLLLLKKVVCDCANLTRLVRDGNRVWKVRIMTFTKRLFDILVAVVLTISLLPVIFLVSIFILMKDGKPIFFISERMKSPTQGFALVKFRTMTSDPVDSGPSGGHKASRITQTGFFLRRTRLDELPQLWNVLVGDISFVGPRPPLRLYVDKYPDLYGKVLRSCLLYTSPSPRDRG